MVNTREWLDRYYPRSERNLVTKLVTDEIMDTYERVELEGALDLADFPNLEILDCHGEKISGLVNINCPNLWIINCSSNLIEEIDLSNCSNLKSLNCSYNKLSNLDLSSNVELTRLVCCNNQIVNLDLSNNGKLSQIWYKEDQDDVLNLEQYYQQIEFVPENNH